jgi:hypothetical protein
MDNNDTVLICILQGGNIAIKRMKKGELAWIMSYGGHVEGRSTVGTTTFSGVLLYP